MIHEPRLGITFHRAVEELKTILREEGSRDRQMKFNDIYVWVSVDSNANDIAIIYDLKAKLIKNGIKL